MRNIICDSCGEDCSDSAKGYSYSSGEQIEGIRPRIQSDKDLCDVCSPLFKDFVLSVIHNHEEEHELLDKKRTGQIQSWFKSGVRK